MEVLGPRCGKQEYTLVAGVLLLTPLRKKWGQLAMASIRKTNLSSTQKLIR